MNVVVVVVLLLRNRVVVVADVVSVPDFPESKFVAHHSNTHFCTNSTKII